MKDLDVNGDGSIDYDEFKVWYLSGFKTQTGGIINAKKAKNMMAGLQGEMSEKTAEMMSALEGAGKKMIKRQVCLQLNQIHDVKNWAKLRFNLLGKDYAAELNKAREWIDLDQGCPSSNDEARLAYCSMRMPFNKNYKGSCDDVLEILRAEGDGDITIDVDYSEEDWLNVKFGFNDLPGRLPSLPEDIVSKLSEFNNYVEANMEFGGAPFKFEGEEFPFDNSAANFFEKVFK